MARVYYSIEICVSIPVHVVLLMATRVVTEQFPVTSPRLILSCNFCHHGQRPQQARCDVFWICHIFLRLTDKDVLMSHSSMRLN